MDSRAGAPRREPGAPPLSVTKLPWPLPFPWPFSLAGQSFKMPQSKKSSAAQPGPPSTEKSESHGHSFLGLPTCWLPQDSVGARGLKMRWGPWVVGNIPSL